MNEAGMIHLYTGDGKGKTTAAVGMAVRALGHGIPVLFCQFLKNGQSGEVRMLSGMEGLTLLMPPPVMGFTFDMSETEKQETAAGMAAFFPVFEDCCRRVKPGMVILDELAAANDCGLLPDSLAARFVHTAAGFGETVVTGRGGREWLRAECDYISEIIAVRHPYEKGIGGREGIEW